MIKIIFHNFFPSLREGSHLKSNYTRTYTHTKYFMYEILIIKLLRQVSESRVREIHYHGITFIHVIPAPISTLWQKTIQLIILPI